VLKLKERYRSLWKKKRDQGHSLRLTLDTVRAVQAAGASMDDLVKAIGNLSKAINVIEGPRLSDLKGPGPYIAQTKATKKRQETFKIRGRD